MTTPSNGLLLLVMLPLASLTAKGQSASIQVPRGSAITLDGTVNDKEWSPAQRIEHPPGTVVRLMRNDTQLLIGITSDRGGFASICLTSDANVHVLHASAALGAVRYMRHGDTWSSADTAFRYGMRNRALNDSAQRERASYLREHGWVATIVTMNDSRSQEFIVALDRFPLPLSIALGRFLLPDGNTVESWPSTIPTNDGCVAHELVRGSVPQGLRFDVTKWLRVESAASSGMQKP
jgi:hypothetical protein